MPDCLRIEGCLSKSAKLCTTVQASSGRATVPQGLQPTINGQLQLQVDHVASSRWTVYFRWDKSGETPPDNEAHVGQPAASHELDTNTLGSGLGAHLLSLNNGAVSFVSGSSAGNE